MGESSDRSTGYAPVVWGLFAHGSGEVADKMNFWTMELRTVFMHMFYFFVYLWFI